MNSHPLRAPIQPRRPSELEYVRAEELCSPQTYVVETDLRGVGRRLRELFQGHRAELDNYADLTGYGPTLLSLLILLRLMQHGFQAPRRALAYWLARSESSVSQAFTRGVELELIERFAHTKLVETITKGRLTLAAAKKPKHQGGGRTGRRKMNVTGITFLTAKGCRVVDGLGFLSTYLPGQEGRKQVRRGVVGAVHAVLASALGPALVRLATAKGGAQGGLLTTLPGSPSTQVVDRTAPVDPRTPKASEKPSSLVQHCDRPTRGAGAPEEVSAHADRLDHHVGGAPLSADALCPLLLTELPSGSDENGRTPLPRLTMRSELVEAYDCLSRGVRSADAWRPHEWRRATPEGRRDLVRRFQTLADLQAVLIPALERVPEQFRDLDLSARVAGPSDATSVPSSRWVFDKRAPHPSHWWTGYASYEHQDALKRERAQIKRESRR